MLSMSYGCDDWPLNTKPAEIYCLRYLILYLWHYKFFLIDAFGGPVETLPGGNCVRPSFPLISYLSKVLEGDCLSISEVSRVC